MQLVANDREKLWDFKIWQLIESGRLTKDCSLFIQVRLHVLFFAAKSLNVLPREKPLAAKVTGDLAQQERKRRRIRYKTIALITDDNDFT